MFHIKHLIKKIKTDKGIYIYDSVSNILCPENQYKEHPKITHFNIKYYYSKEELLWKIKNSQNMLTISLTEKCNLRCEYCGYHKKYEDRQFKFSDISVEEAIHSVETFLDSTQATENPSISFYGGEPLLRFEVIQKVVEFCEKNFPLKKIGFSITTNGLLLSRIDILNFLISHNFFITISLDGPKEIHDRYRIDAFGNPTFETIEKNLNTILNINPNYYANNISINTVMAPPTDLTKISKFFEQKNIDRVFYINFLETAYFRTKYKISNKNNSDPTFLNSLMKSAYLGTLKKYCNLVPNINFDTNVFPGGMCLPGVRRNFIHSDGRIILCEKVSEQEDFYNLGTVEQGINIDKVWKLIKDIEKIASKRCTQCWAVRFCNRCFLDFFDNDISKCNNVKNIIYRDIKYYIENIMFDPEQRYLLENMTAY